MKNFKQLLAILLVISIALLAVGCSESNGSKITDISISYNDQVIANNELSVGITLGEITLGVSITGKRNPSQEYTLQSSNLAVATIGEDNKIALVGVGDTFITATSTADTSKTATITLTVVNDNTYTITAVDATADKVSAMIGETITLTPAEKDGFAFVSWESDDVEVSSENTFVMPDKNVTVTAVFQKLPDVSAGTPLTFTNMGHVDMTYAQISSDQTSIDLDLYSPTTENGNAQPLVGDNITTQAGDKIMVQFDVPSTLTEIQNVTVRFSTGTGGYDSGSIVNTPAKPVIRLIPGTTVSFVMSLNAGQTLGYCMIQIKDGSRAESYPVTFRAYYFNAGADAKPAGTAVTYSSITNNQINSTISSDKSVITSTYAKSNAENQSIQARVEPLATGNGGEMTLVFNNPVNPASEKNNIILVTVRFYSTTNVQDAGIVNSPAKITLKIANYGETRVTYKIAANQTINLIMIQIKDDGSTTGSTSTFETDTIEGITFSAYYNEIVS